MDNYFQIAYIEDDITMYQVFQLYKLKVIDLDKCAYIFNIQKDSVKMKFRLMRRWEEGKYRFPDGNRKTLFDGEKKRLIEMLEAHNQKIIEVLNGSESEETK